MPLKKNDRVTFDEYAVDRSRWRLEWQSQPIAINRKTFDLLLFLIDHRERVVGKEELLQVLWPDQFVEESNLTQHVFLLRKALSRHASGKKLVETVPGRGYRFTAAVTEVQPDADQIYIGASQSIARITIEEEDDAELESATAAVLPEGPAADAFRTRRRYGPIAAGAAILIVLCGAGWVGRQRWMDRNSGPPVQVILTPMEGSTGDPGLDRALVSSLRMDLSQSPFVSVVAGDTLRATLVEMKLDPDAAMTVATAREVCERTNSQAVLHGTVAKDGKHFLITEEATSCVDGSSLAADKQEAARLEELPHAIDTLAESIRRKLGESSRSIARFSAPLLPENTSSLEALKAYSESERVSDEGRMADAISLMKQAIAADPNFAIAYGYLAAAYFNTGDRANNRAAILKAYALRDSAAPVDRLFIIAHYDMEVVGDLFEAERDCQTWAQLYPRSPMPWNSLSVVQRQLGHYSEAVVSAARGESLRQKNAPLMTNLAVDQMHAGDLHGARATCDRAIAAGVDVDRIRSAYLSIAFLLHDLALMRAQRAWFAAHPQSPYFLMTEAQIAMAEGRFTNAQQLTGKSIELLRQQGLDDVAASTAKAAGVALIEAGDVVEGKRLFQSVPIDAEDGADLVGLVEVGNVSTASNALRSMREKYPNGTLLNLYWGPRVEAGVAMAAHRPGEAITALEATRPLERRGLEIQKLRADALLADDQFHAAEKEYRNILTYPELDPVTTATPLAWLGLGRALAAEGQVGAARDAYQHFFNLWAHSDANAAFLAQAKEEVGKLQTRAVQ